MKEEETSRTSKHSLKVLKNLKKLHEDLQNFHRSKVLSNESLFVKITKHLEVFVEPQPLLVPSGLQTNTVLHLPKPLQCCVHVTTDADDVYVGHYGGGPENGLFTWSKPLLSDGLIKRTKMLLNCRIKSLVFVNCGFLYFASCDDLTLRVFNNKFREQSVSQLQYSILSMIYDGRQNVVVSGSVGAVQQWMVPTPMHRKPTLLREIKLYDHVNGITPWIAFLELDKEQNRIMALAGTALFFVDAVTFEEVAFVENRHSFPMTACFSYVPRQYLITGAKNGGLKVWNMSMKSFPYVDCFTGHLKRIVRILVHPNEPLLITASEDSTIRFWRIETFQETYRFNVLDTVCDLCLVGPRKLYFTSPRYVCLLDFNYFHSIFTLVGSKCTSITRYAPSADKPSRIMVVGDDGGVRIVSPTHGNILTILFPVVTHKPIAYTHDPLEHRIYVLLHDGGVMVISTKTNPCRTIQLWRVKGFDEKLICMGLLFVNIGVGGGERKSLLFGAHRDGCISLLKGTDLEMIKASPGRGVITEFVANTEEDSFAHFLTYNTERTISIWKIKVPSEGRIELDLIENIELRQPPSHIAFRGNSIALATENYLVTLQVSFANRGKSSVNMFKHSKDEAHQKSITQLTSCSGIPLFATSSLDGRIKIWNVKCHLVRELVFDNTLSGLCFANARGDILVGFQSNLHYVPLLEYLPNEYLQMLLDGNIGDDGIEYCISFDPLLKFWYDPDRVPSIWLRTSNHPVVGGDDSVVQQFSQLCLQQMSDYANVPNAESGSELETKTDTAEQPRRLKKHSITLESLKNSRRNSLFPCESSSGLACRNTQRSGLPILSGTVESVVEDLLPMTTALNNEIMAILSGDSLTDYENGITVTQSPKPNNAHQKMPTKKYWPCAPDGFIPNSVIRALIVPKKSVLVKQEPWKLKPIKFVEEKIEISFYEQEEEDNRVLEWCSEEEQEEHEDVEEQADEMNIIFSKQRKRSPFGAKPKRFQKKESAKEKTPLQEQVSKKIIDKFRSFSNQPTLHPTLQPKKKLAEEITEEKVQKEVKVEIKEPVKSAKPKIPPPFDGYIDKRWFPKGIDLMDIEAIVKALIEILDPEKPFVLKEILTFLGELHRIHTIPEDSLKELQETLLGFLDHHSGQVRHYTVNALLDLGENKKEVILRLVRGLADPDFAVREEIKVALKQMAGIGCTDTLIAVLQQFGEYRDTEMARDVEVVKEHRDAIVDKRTSYARRMPLQSEVHHHNKHNVFRRLDDYHRERGKRKLLDSAESERIRKEKIEEQIIRDSNFLATHNKQQKKTRTSTNQQESQSKRNKRVQRSKRLSNNNKKSSNEKVLLENNEQHSNLPRVTLSSESLDDQLDIDDVEGESPYEHQAVDWVDINKEHLLLPTATAHRYEHNSEVREKQDSKTERNTVDEIDYGARNLGICLLNKRMIGKSGEVKEDALKELAPHIYEKFSIMEQDGDILKKLLVTGDLLNRLKETNLSPNSEKEEEEASRVPVRDFQLRIMAINNATKASTDGKPFNTPSHLKESSIKNGNKRREVPVKKPDLLIVQRNVLATAISALNSKRRNINANSCLAKHGLVGNHALNDINVLLQMFNKPSRQFDSKSLNNVSDILEELQEEMGLQPAIPKNKMNGKSYRNNSHNLGFNDETDVSNKVEHFRFIPSPVQKNMVPGVQGERILSSLHVLPSIPKGSRDNHWRMKAIPERHGNSTVLLNSGQTNYGSMAFHWTTLTSSYDMNQHNSNSYRHYQLNSNQQQQYVLPGLSKLTEKSVLNCVFKKWNHCILTPPKLRSLVCLDQRGSSVNSANNFYQNGPAPPNTALAFSK